jgi:UDP-N-acetyl-alpha-D-muramoyl-L-alanyl-L-glutamate epimerase
VVPLMTATAQLDKAGVGEFRYGEFDLDARTRTLTCVYLVGGRRFEERIVVERGSTAAPGVEAAATLVFLLAGVSYYKAFAPRVIDLGDFAVPPMVRSFLRDFYVDGLGEFAYRNDLDLRNLQVVGGRDVPDRAPGTEGPAQVESPLVPFGGGMDSLVSVGLVARSTPDASLFVVSGVHDRFDAIEQAAATTGLPVLRATRQLDDAILRSRELGFLNGHVPVTGIVSAIAVLAAAMSGRDAVVMSNEWSASAGNVDRDGQSINHQYSKSLDFERAFRDAVRTMVGAAPAYFSLLRPFSSLWIAREFASHPGFLGTFRSCNRAFHIDPDQRLDRWCGQCDKCLFVDLILSPFVDRTALAGVFGGHEPLDDPDRVDAFRTLIGTTAEAKPFECVGDVDECRAAVLLAAARPDRTGSPVLRALRDEIGGLSPPEADVDALLAPLSEHFVPEPYASALRLA